MTDVYYGFDTDAPAPIDEAFWDTLTPLDVGVLFRGTVADHSRLDVVAVTAPATPTPAPAQPAYQDVSPMDGEYAGLARVDNAAQAAVRDDAAAAFSRGGGFFSGAPSSANAWPADGCPSPSSDDEYPSDFVDDEMPDDVFLRNLSYTVPDVQFAPHDEASVSVGSSPSSLPLASPAAAFSFTPLPGRELNVDGVSPAYMPMDMSDDDSDDDDGGASPTPSDGGSKAFHGGVLPDTATRRCAAIARDSILATVEREKAPFGRRAAKRSPVASPPASSPMSSSSVRRRSSVASSSSSSSLSAPPSPGAESDVGDATSDDDRTDDAEQRKVRRVSSQAVKVPRYPAMIDPCDDDDVVVVAPRPRVVLDLCGDDDKLVALNPREHLATPRRPIDQMHSIYGGRTVRSLPKPALLYGAVHPPAGEYPPALIVRSSCSGKKVHSEFNETLGYDIEVRANARDWGNNLMNESIRKIRKHMSMEAKQRKAWHTKMRHLFEQEVDRVMTAWRVFYGMDENPSQVEIARDLTLMWRWIVDTHGDSTGTGKF